MKDCPLSIVAAAEDVGIAAAVIVLAPYDGLIVDLPKLLGLTEPALRTRLADYYRSTIMDRWIASVEHDETARLAREFRASEEFDAWAEKMAARDLAAWASAQVA